MRGITSVWSGVATEWSDGDAFTGDGDVGAVSDHCVIRRQSYFQHLRRKNVYNKVVSAARRSALVRLGSCYVDVTVCLSVCHVDVFRGGSRNFGKGGPGKGAKPRTERRRRERRRGASPENFEKLDAISCNLAYIFGIRMASDIIQFQTYFFRHCIQCRK